MDVSDYRFSFFRANGEVISDNVSLGRDGYIYGIDNKNEFMWKEDGGTIFFLNEAGEVTTEFHTKIEKNGDCVFLGKFLGNEDSIAHILIGHSDSKDISDLKQYISTIENRLESLDATLGIGVRKMRRIGDVRKIMFLIHNMATWDSVEDVFRKLDAAKGFEAIVASIPRRFPGEADFGHADETYEKLLEKGISPIRLSGTENDLHIVKMISPDGIFRQSPWDHDIPDVFSTRNLSFSNLFYIPYYGFNIVDKFTSDPDERDYQADQDFHRACGLVFCESDLTKDMMSRKSRRGGDNFVVTGHPKLERLISAKEKPEWPIHAVDSGEEGKKPLKIIWAPHHSVTQRDWLSFGLFPEVYEDMLAWVREDKNVEIVLKPHPALFGTLVSNESMTQVQMDEFIAAWTGLPNATIVDGGDYGPLLSASDVMVTDGISFLAEYHMFWDKPLIFMENKNHSPFNEMGKMIESACYITHTVNDVRACLERVIPAGGDINSQKRKEVYEKLLPFKTGAAERIVKKLRTFFL